MHIIGARPHFMKLAPISMAIRASSDFEETIVHTGQHYSSELSESFIKEFELPEPHHRLEIGSASHCKQIGKVLIALEEIFTQERPDIVFVYGDTNSTAAGAIAAAKSGIPIAHVEAGLREWNKAIPEEVNKLLTDAVSDLFFCPTQTGVDNLAKSGITENVFLTGDTVLDLLEKNTARIESSSVPILSEFQLERGEYYFVTCHRAANTDNQFYLREILTAITQLDKRVLFAMHPRTTKAIETHGLNTILEDSNVTILPSLGFWDTQALIRNAKHVITDSGGVIKEAYFHGIPCVVIDRQTEWVEAVNAGWVQIAGPVATAIKDAVNNWTPPSVHAPEISGRSASKEILKHTRAYLSKFNNSITKS